MSCMTMKEPNLSKTKKKILKYLIVARHPGVMILTKGFPNRCMVIRMLSFPVVSSLCGSLFTFYFASRKEFRLRLTGSETGGVVFTVLIIRKEPLKQLEECIGLAPIKWYQFHEEREEVILRDCRLL